MAMRESTKERNREFAEISRQFSRDVAAQQGQSPLTVEERKRMQLEMEQNTMDVALIESYFASQKRLNRALYDLRCPEKEQN